MKHALPRVFSETCVAVNDAQSRACLNASVLVKRMSRAVGQAFPWSVAGKRESLNTRPQPALADVANPCDLPLAVGIAAASREASEATAESVIVRRNGAEQRSLAELLQKRALLSIGVGPVRAFNVSCYEQAAAERLKACGALVGAHAELGERTLALNVGAVSWSVTHGSRSPTQRIRWIPDELPPKPSRLQVFKLQKEGWRPSAETPTSWKPGEPMLAEPIR